ncbi:MAG: HD domain-containing protein, partial [bacterium]|nr:HD domain-containing protein [bacterium]
QLADIVLYHHERYDGAGYPTGLAGNRIPIESRLLAVADAYTAMTSPRPYRSAFSHHEAVQRICEAAGTQFDPAVVDAFLSHFGSEHGEDLLLNPGGALRAPAAQPVACAVE